MSNKITFAQLRQPTDRPGLPPRLYGTPKSHVFFAHQPSGAAGNCFAKSIGRTESCSPTTWSTIRTMLDAKGLMDT